MTLSTTINKLVLSFSIVLIFSFTGVYGQCGFTPNQRTGCRDYLLNLQDTTTGSTNTNWAITFSDHTVYNTNNNRQASKRMTICGKVIVTMTTTVGGIQCTKTDSNFQVSCPPVIRGAFAPDAVCVGQNVCYTDASTASSGCYPLKYVIDWGQSPLDTIPGCRKYTLAGNFCPSVIITDACGCITDSAFSGTNCIKVTAPPVASFTGAPLTSCTTPLTSTMTAAVGNAGTIYKWYLNGSNTPAQSGHSNIFTYAYPTGTYSIKLITTDSATGCSDTMSRASYVTVGNAPAACYTTSISSGCAPKAVNYCSCSPGGISYAWSFPGGSPSSSTSTTSGCVNVLYAAPGVYSSQLIVYYNGGCIDTLQKNNSVIIGQPYTLGIVSPDSFSCTVPDTVHLVYTGQACPSCQFAWNPPGNSAPASHIGTIVILNTYQNYTPVLTVTDTFGCVSTLVKNNYIKAQRLKAKTTITTFRQTCINDTFLVANTTLGGPFSSVTWSFPGGVTYSGGRDSIYVKYTSSGCHKYTMIVATNTGCIDTLRDSICVGSKPVVSLSVSPKDVCYEQGCNLFTVSVTAGSDTPTSVLIWPQGLGNAATTTIIDTPGRPITSCYVYKDIGAFLPCFVAKYNGCLGDTQCLSLPSDTVHIFAPAAKFLTIQSCSGSTVTYINASKLADSIVWHIGGSTFINRDTVTYTYSGPCNTGHPVSLTAFNFASGCVHTKKDTTTLPCTGVDFAADGPRKGCSGYQDTIRLIYANSSVARPTRIVWDVRTSNSPPNFSNPAPANMLDRVRVAFNGAGIFQVCVQLTFANGCVDTICKPDYLSVSIPHAAFTISDTAGCVPFGVQFTNTSTFFSAVPQAKFIWSFGDASSIDTTTVAPLHVYTGINHYVASLTVVDTNGCSSIATRNLTSNSVTANFTASDTITCQANPDTLNPLTFTNTSTGFVAHYKWIVAPTLGPVNANPGDVPSFSTRFTQEGTDSVCLVAIDQYNICRDTICKRITVRNPVADYTFSNLQDTLKVCPRVVVNPFFDLSTNDICKCYWDFGDGSHFDTACNASHIYIQPGVFPVMHIVTSCHGCSDTVVKYTINIKGPVLQVTADKKGGCPCTPISLFISSYDADSLVALSDARDSTLVFTGFRIPRGTPAHPTLDTITFSYCGVGDHIPSITAVDFLDNCPIEYHLNDTLVIDTPTVSISYTRGACGTDSFCFSDFTTYTSPHAYTVQRAWDFGDGTPVDSSPTPCHHYTAPGDYPVSLSIRNNVGCFKTAIQVIHVPRRPVAQIWVDDTVGCVPLLLHFRDSTHVDDSTSIVSGFWDFGDGTSFNTYTDTTHTYTVANTPPARYTAMLVVQDGYGCTDTARRQIQVKPTPTLTVAATQQVCLGDTITLSASGSPVLHWFPSYNIDTTNPGAARVWSRNDTTYYVRAGDVPRCYIYDSIRVHVSVITASDTATGLCLGQTTTFTGRAQSTYATISSYLWRFGDGASATGQTVSHHYAVYGTYIDSMIVVNSAGCRDTIYGTIVIGDKPHAHIGISDSVTCLGDTVAVTNTSIAGTSAALGSFSIDMQPDGVVDYTTSPVSYVYPANGRYTISLIQSDINGCVDTARQGVIVHNNPISAFNPDSSCILISNRLSGTTAVGDGGIAHYQWTIDGVVQSADSAVIYRTFTTPGNYNVCLSVSDVFGCKSPDSCSKVMIISQPKDTIDPLDTTICLGYSAGFHIKGRFSTIQWVPATWLDNPTGTDVVATPRQPIRYLVYAGYGHCNPKVDTVSIYVIDSVPVSASANPENIVLGLSSNVTSTVKGTIDSIVWDQDSTLSCRNCRNPIARPHTTTTYTATIYYSKNNVVCSNRATVTVTVITSCDNSLIYVPNTFTPNNDNTNDVFRIRGQGISKVNYFRVYDRWGKIVYQANNVENPDDAAWNGGLNNERARPENSGVFVYVFEIQCVTGQTVTGKGNVTLIR